MQRSSPVEDSVDRLFAGGGAMGERMRAFDWNAHPLGPPEGWPQSLRIVIRLILTSRYAMWLGWGPELFFFYNDAYQPTLGIKDDWALGAPASRVWAEIWADIGPRADSVVATGKATWDEALRLFLERSGAPEETYHTFSYSPVPDDAGGTGGMLCVVTEETDRVIGERRLAFLRELAAEFARCNNESEVLEAIATEFGAHPEDVPFALVYLLEGDGQTATLARRVGMRDDHAAAPLRIGLDDSQALWPLGEVWRTGQPIDLFDLDERSPEALPSGPWDRPVRAAKVVPLTVQGEEHPAGFLVAGLNPYRPVGEAYRGFIRLLAGQISAGLSTARAYEAERRRAEALAELDRAKTEFFSNVSHEFRTPLTLMLAPLEDELRERKDRREGIETAHRNALRLLKLVNSLLDFSRLEAGRAQAAYVATDLGRFTAELASAFEPVVEKAGLRLIVDCPPLPAPVHLDRTMWEKIVFNLLSNAFKFTFTGEIEVTVRPRGDWVELAVRDTGTGIPAAELPRIFDRFHRVQGAKSRSHEGTGIGLALVNQLVRLHGGEVTVESREGVGTTFRVRLPAGAGQVLPGPGSSGPAEPAGRLGAAAFVEEARRWLPEGVDADDVPAAAAEPGALQGRIVLADDNHDMRAYLARLLGSTHEVEAVADGQAALEAIQANPPDLVLSDVMMPRLDGFGLLKRLRAQPETAAIPVILLSARAGEDARVEGLQRGADDYLVKPFSARELLARVQTHLELARMRREAAEKIRESEERFRHVADHSPTMFWVSEPDGTCSYFNDRWYEYTGLSREETLGFGWMRAIHPDERADIDQALARARAAKEKFRVQYRLRRHDGEYRWMLDEGAPRLPRSGFAGFVGSIVDITEQREELEEIERSRSQMQLALQAARSGAFMWDLVAGTITWSEELEALYGLKPGGFGGTYKDWTHRVPAEDLAEVETALKEVIAHRRQEADFEFRIILPDGTRRWMMCKARIGYAANGQARQIVGINFDIDERKRVQMNTELINRLGQEIARMSDPDAIERAAVEAVGQALEAQRCFILAVDEPRTGGHVRACYTAGPEVPRFQGFYSLADFGGSAVWAEMSSHGVAIEDVRSDPLTRGAADRYLRHDVAAWMAAPFGGEGRWRAGLGVTSDRPRRWTSTERDLLEQVVSRVWPNVERARTEQAMAEAQLAIRLSEERLRATVAAARLGTWDYNPRTRGLVWDARSKELFGLPPAAADDVALALTGVHPADLERMRERARVALQPGGDGSFDVEFRTVGIRDRVERSVRMTGQASFDGETPVRLVGTLLDITEIVKARETLAERRAELERQVAERTARLQETVGELESFSYSISHDLRAPLRAMQSFAQLLADECSAQLGPDGRDYVRRIVAGSARMDRLIHDVLVYSRVARTELALGPVALQPLIDGIVESYPQFSAAAADVVVARNLPVVIGNEAALTQCVSNLIGNAVKFVAPGVRPRVEVGCEVVDGRAKISFSDNGIGIPPDMHEKIFGIFERVSRSYEGTGIGLAVVRKAAERMGGSITLHSEVERGSKFVLELPLAPAA